MPNALTLPMPMHMALSTPMITAARKAPGMLPMPPTTTTTNTSASIVRSMVSTAGSRGIWIAPPRPARNEPSANTLVNSHAWFTPSAPAISRSSVAARTSVPQRVRVSSSQSRPSTIGPSTIRNRSYSGNCLPAMSTAAPRPGARGPSRSSGPQTQSAKSRTINTSAKVASSCNSSGAW